MKPCAATEQQPRQPCCAVLLLAGRWQLGIQHGPLASLCMGLQVRTQWSPIRPILANVAFSAGSICVRGRQLGDRLITFNGQVYVVADLKKNVGLDLKTLE